MEIKHKDLLPDDSKPFLHCQLGRQKYADALSTIVNSYADGFVLAINGEWGTGKTTFVKMWQASLQNDEYKTIYFNAWENDFENEPLTALLGEFKKLVVGKNDSFKSLLKKGAIITKNVLPALAKGVISKYLDAGVALDVLEKSIDAASDLLDKEVDEYVNKKQGLIEFKKELEKYIISNSGGRPVIFIIDELDRCRPDYAVEILEKIKHFFSVKGIVFVLSIDKLQLGHSIQGYYGSSNINTKEYLRRFIDLEYSLPNPDSSIYCTYLYDYYQFGDFFDTQSRTQYSVLRGDGDRFRTFASKLFSVYNYTLRQQEKIFAHSRIILRTFAENSYVFPQLLMLLIHLRERDIEIYNKIKDLKFSIQDLVVEYEKLFSTILLDEIRSGYSKEFMSIESLLLLFYNNSYRRDPNKRSIASYELVKSQDNISELSFKTTIDNDLYSDKLLKLLTMIDNVDYYEMGLQTFTNKIDLLENIS